MVAPGDTIEANDRTFEVGDRLYEGDICDIFACTYTEESQLPPNPTVYDRIVYEDGEIERQGVLKITREPYNNDLVENEAAILGRLYPPDQADEKFYRYLPKLVTSVRYDGRQGNVFPRFEGFHSLAEILGAFPEGIDFRDMVWMFKRALAGLGFVHTSGLVHGAVVPSHVLVHPIGHGAKLIDWCYAVEGAKKIGAFVPTWQHFYAPEILQKLPATPATDVYMLCKAAIALVGGNVETNEMPDAVPEQIQNFLRTAVLLDQRRRPSDAWDLHEKFDKLLERVVGKRKYRPFHMPGEA